MNRRRSPRRDPGVSSTLEKTRALRHKVEGKFLPLFDHLLTLAADSMRSGRMQRAGQELRKARELAGSTKAMRPAAKSKRVNRKWLGSKMLEWHGGMNDPIYAVGSFYVDGRAYPQKDVVERAVAGLEEDERLARTGEQGRHKHPHGWGKREAGELRSILQGLRFYLRHDYSAGGLRPGVTPGAGGAAYDPRRRSRRAARSRR